MRSLFTIISLLIILPVFGQHYTEPDSTYLQQMRMSASSQDWDIQINEIAAINNETVTDDHGEYEDWVEIYNYGDDEVDLNLAYVTDDPDNPTQHQLIEESPGELIIPPGGFLILWADDQPEQGATHLGFSLSGSGEYFGISEPDDVILIDGVTFGQQISDVTYGRIIDGSEWNYYPTPTPGAPNDTEGLFEIIEKPVYNYNEAFFNGSLEVTINVSDPAATIYYTTDGSNPTEGDSEYTTPLILEELTMLRARAFKVDALPSRIATNSFIPQETFELDVISLVTDDSHLWGSSGIYDNRYSGIEKPIHVEYFDAGGALQFEIDGGVKIHAPDNRPQQSLRLFARSNYGDTRIEYPIFEGKDVDWYKRLVLRNAANDGQQLARTHFRDCLAHELFSEIDPDNIYSASKPVNVYLNGEYWGIYNLRERQDHHFIESNYGYTDIDFLERTATTADTRDQQVGDWENYDAMRDYLMENDMADENHFEVIEDWIDIRNYVDYMVTEIWTANRDWITNNVKFYRPRNIPEAKWKWILWDTEYGMGCYPANDHGNPNFDALHMSMSWGGWPPHWGTTTGTYMMHNLVDNPGFVDYFITRHADLLNSHLRSDRVLEKIDEFVALYEGDMPKQVDRWAYSMNTWYNAIQTFENWVNPRPSFCREHILNKWDHVTDEHIITLNVQPEGAGYIEVNTIYTDELPWEGYYFEGVPVKLTAVAHTGYEFVEWLETGFESIDLEVWMESDSALTALFQPSDNAPELVVINEINYKSAPFLDTDDWVELTNAGDAPVAIGGWEFRDNNDNNIFTFPEGTTIDTGEFFILSRDLTSFNPHYPNMTSVYGPLGFGFNNSGELLRLYNADGTLMDHVEYGVVAPWPTSPNGMGQTLELIDPTFDNTLAQNWFARDETGGTPGEPNTFVTSVSENKNFPLLAYPNPTPGILNVRTSSEVLPVEVQVYNMLGQQVESFSSREQNFTVNLSQQTSGMYLLNIHHREGTGTLRIIKE